jgi:hypothetical protein
MFTSLKSVAVLALAMGALLCSPAHAFDLVYASGVGTCNGVTPGALDQVNGRAVTAPAGATENVSITFFSLTNNASSVYTTAGWLPGTIKLSGGPADLDLENVTPSFVLQYGAYGIPMTVVYGQATYKGQTVNFAVTLATNSDGSTYFQVELDALQNVNNWVQVQYIVAGTLKGTVIE